MDTQLDTNQATNSDETELAKALAAISDDGSAPAAPSTPITSEVDDAPATESVDDVLSNSAAGLSPDSVPGLAPFSPDEPIHSLDSPDSGATTEPLTPSDTDLDAIQSPSLDFEQDPIETESPLATAPLTPSPDLAPLDTFTPENADTNSEAPAPSSSPSMGELASVSFEQHDSSSENLDPELESVKGKALDDLRPLMSRIDVNPTDKFNLYLLMIQQSKDRSLIEPAYEAAHSIEDEGKKAQALLDIIREIDQIEHSEN